MVDDFRGKVFNGQLFRVCTLVSLFSFFFFFFAETRLIHVCRDKSCGIDQSGAEMGSYDLSIY